jgi:hypothetical protein
MLTISYMIAALKWRIPLDTCLSHPKIDTDDILGHLFTRHCRFWTRSCTATFLPRMLYLINQTFSRAKSTLRLCQSRERPTWRSKLASDQAERDERVQISLVFEVAETPRASNASWDLVHILHRDLRACLEDKLKGSSMFSSLWRGKRKIATHLFAYSFLPPFSAPAEPCLQAAN